MPPNEVSYIIRAWDRTKEGLTSAVAGLSAFATRTRVAAADMGTSFARGFGTVRAVGGQVFSALSGMFGGLPGLVLMGAIGAASLIGNVLAGMRERAAALEREAMERLERIKQAGIDAQNVINSIVFPNGDDPQGKMKTSLRDASKISDRDQQIEQVRKIRDAAAVEEEKARKVLQEPGRQFAAWNNNPNIDKNSPAFKEMAARYDTQQKEAVAAWLQTKEALKLANEQLSKLEGAAAKAAEAEAAKISKADDLWAQQLEEQRVRAEEMKAAQDAANKEQADRQAQYDKEQALKESAAQQKDYVRDYTSSFMEDAQLQAAARRQAAQGFDEAADYHRRRALDPAFRKETDREMERAAKEERHFQGLLQKAARGVTSKEIREAVMADSARKEAARLKGEADALDKAAKQAQLDSVEVLKRIDDNLKRNLASN